MGVWEYAARWFRAEAGLDNSNLLQPLPGEPSAYAVINHARMDTVARVVGSMTKPSFGAYVMANIAANGATAMPALYRQAP